MKNFYDRSDIKLSFDKLNKRFFVNEKKRIVVCVIESHLNTPFSFSSQVIIPNEYFKGTGVAKCHEDDVFDVEKGKRIALAKAENNTYKMATNYLNEWYNNVDFFIKAICEFKVKANEQCGHNLEYIQCLTNENHPKYKKELTNSVSGKTTIIN